MEGKEEIFDVDMTNSDLLDIVKYEPGDLIQFSYTEDEEPAKVTEIK